jgi:hypothetical protein
VDEDEKQCRFYHSPAELFARLREKTEWTSNSEMMYERRKV